jgi:uncharacterized membrane protein YdbT with pleckstrin-like domain
MHGRTHAKILALPILLQIGLIVLHVIVWRFFPEDGWGIDGLGTWGPVVLHGLIIIAEVIFIVVPILQWLASTYTLTNLRVSQQWGIIVRRSHEVSLDRIAAVSTERSIIDRIFGCGTLVLHDVSINAESSSGVRFHDVPRVEEVRAKINQLIY